MIARPTEHAPATLLRLGRTALAAVAVLLLAGCTSGGPSAPAPARSAASAADPASRATTTAPPFAGTVLRSFAVPVGRPVVAAAATGVLYTAVDRGEDGANWRIERLDAATGAVVERTLHLPRLRTLTAGPNGLYATTSVIDKYGREPDTIVRLDLATLRTLAERRLDDGAIWDLSLIHI